MAGPPGSQGYPAGYGPPPGFAAAESSSGTKVGAGLLWSLLAAIALAVAVSVKEDGQNGWERIGVWAGFAIVAALATAAPAIRSNLNLDAEKAWKVAAAGAVGLAAFWVLFILPSIERNVSFVATLGCVAGAVAAWTAPGRPRPAPDDRGQTW